ncbi:Acryloyl-CoA reductase electron transfer subunit gamma, partial [termite gut metagenome]
MGGPDYRNAIYSSVRLWANSYLRHDTGSRRQGTRRGMAGQGAPSPAFLHPLCQKTAQHGGDGTVNRAALPAIFNPEDLNALEQALRLKDIHQGTTITILTMG